MHIFKFINNLKNNHWFFFKKYKSNKKQNFQYKPVFEFYKIHFSYINSYEFSINKKLDFHSHIVAKTCKKLSTKEYGFKFLLKNNLGPIDYLDTKKVELMNCCLDVHSNILLSNNSLNKPIYLPTFNITNYKDIPENKNFKTKNYIRGPPRFI